MALMKATHSSKQHSGRKKNLAATIFQIHNGNDNAPAAKKQRLSHEQPVPGMKKDAQLFSSMQQQQRQRQIQQRPDNE